jgi:uncharacterized membrane protein YkoI
MKRPSPAFFILFLWSSAVHAAGDPGPIPISAAPPAVQKAVAAAVGSGQLKEIDRSTDGGETFYDISFTGTNGVQQERTMADDGGVLYVGVGPNDLNDALRKAIATAAGDWQVVEIDKDLEDQEITYDIDVVKGGLEKGFTVAANGDLVSKEVSLVETPALVQLMIKTRLGAVAPAAIDENFDPDGNDFDVTATAANGAPLSFSVTDAGVLESVEITLNDVTIPARATILQQVGAGKILRIDRDIGGGRKRGQGFDVESRINGKDYDFSVGPRGRLLGEDQ